MFPSTEISSFHRICSMYSVSKQRSIARISCGFFLKPLLSCTINYHLKIKKKKKQQLSFVCCALSREGPQVAEPTENQQMLNFSDAGTSWNCQRNLKFIYLPSQQYGSQVYFVMEVGIPSLSVHSVKHTKLSCCFFCFILFCFLKKEYVKKPLLK